MLGVFSRGWARLRSCVLGGVSRESRCAATRPLRGAWLIAAALAAAALALPGVSFATPNDATLSNITLSAGVLGSPFDPTITSYNVSEAAGQSSISVTAPTNDPGATITVNGTSVPFNTASGAINLAFGNNTINIVVTSQDTTATKTYTLTVNRALSANDTLSSLTISAGTLTPAFDPNTLSYTASVSTGTASLTITPTLADSHASMTVNAQAATSGAAFGPVSLNYGTNSIGVQVTAQDGNTTQAYTVTVTRPTPAGTPQTISFNNPGTQNFGTSPTLTATASSGLTVSFSSSATGVCTITSGGALTFVTTGTCTIAADQAGNGTYAPASTVTQSFSVAAVVPGAPTIGTATGGDTQASVSFTAPASNGGASITGYTVTANPGGATGSCASSPCTVTGLTNGTAYTFTVTATNSAGTGAASAASNGATPKAAQTITFANPGAQTFGTTPTLTATATSSLTVAFSSSTTGVCTITSGGALTFVSAGTCTINADQAGNGSFLAATTVSRSFAVNAVVPGAPTVGALTPGNGQIGVAFTAPASNGGATITSYTVTSSPGGLTASGAAGPLVVSGLTNGTAYTFTVTATNSAGTGPASAASSPATPAVLSTNANLSALSLSSVTLSPSFAGGTTSYTASVANGTASTTVTPTLADSNATVKVNGTTVTSGSPSGAISLAVGANTITVLATAQDGSTTRTYTVTVTRAAAPPPPPPSADLASLSVLANGSTRLPTVPYNPTSTSYTAAVTNDVASVTVVAVPPVGASVTINGQTEAIDASSSTAGVAVPLSLGANTITIVSSQGSTSKTYTLTIIRPYPANDDNLASITWCSTDACRVTGTVALDPATTAYNVSLTDPAITGVYVEPIVEASGAQTSMIAGQSSRPVPVSAGRPAIIEILVVAPDYRTHKTYTVTFTKGAASADLKALVVSAGATLSQAFASGTLSYTANVSADTPSITVMPTAQDPAATVTMTTVSDGKSVSGPVPLTPGVPTSIAVKVTATDGHTKTYFVNAWRAQTRQLAINPWKALGVPSGKIGELYAATFVLEDATGDVTWTATGLPDGVKLYTGQTTLPPGGSQTPSGSATLMGLPTKAGTFNVTLTVDAGALGKGSTSFPIQVTGGPATGSGLASLNVDAVGAAVTLSPPFDPATTDYTATVGADVTTVHITTTPQSGATIFGGYDPLPKLQTGANIVTIKSGAIARSDKTIYTLTIIRASNNADLKSLSICSVQFCAPAPDFSAATTAYAVTIQSPELFVRAETAESHATVKVNGTPLAAGEASTPIRMGPTSTTITVQVTAQDGTTKTYTVTNTQQTAMIIQSTLPDGQAGKPYSGQIVVTGGTVPYTIEPRHLAGGGDLPPGFTLTERGVLSGTATAQGSYTFGVRARDAMAVSTQGLVTVKFSAADSAAAVTVHVTMPVTIPQAVPMNLFQADVGSVVGLSSSHLAVTSVTAGAPAAARASATTGKAPAGLMAGSAGQTLGGSSGSAPVLNYTPLPNAMGVDHVVVTALLVDGSTQAAALDFQIAGKAPDLTMQTAANGIATLDPLAGVVGGPFMGVQILAPPQFGQVIVSGLQITYIPDPAHLGTTSFVYAVDLGFGLSAPGTVTVTTGQAVSAQALSATTHAGQPVSLDLTGQAQGGPFSSAAVVSVSPSTAGTASVRSTGNGTFALDFMPAGTFTGSVAVGYSLTAGGATDVNVATITVQPRPDPSQDPEVRAIVSATDQAVRTFARSQLDNFNRRLESLRGGGSGGFDMKLGFATPPDGTDPRETGAWRMQRLAEQSAKDPTAPAGQDARSDVAPSGGGGRPAQPSPFGAWVAGVIQIGHADATSGRRDYRLSTSGVSAGVDYRLSDRLVVGAGLGYGHDDAKIGARGSKLSGDSTVGAAYGAWLPTPGTFVDAVLGYGKLDFGVDRFSADASKMLTGSRSGTLLFGSLRAGLDRTRGGLHVSPYGEVSFIDGRLDAFTETGDPTWALSYSTQDVRSLASTLGLRFDIQRKLSRERTLTPRLRLEWRHEFDGAGDQILSYADWAGSPRYVVPADQLGRDELSVELGGRLQLEHQLSLDLGYRGMFSNGMRTGAWTLRLDHSF